MSRRCAGCQQAAAVRRVELGTAGGRRVMVAVCGDDCEARFRRHTAAILAAIEGPACPAATVGEIAPLAVSLMRATDYGARWYSEWAFYIAVVERVERYKETPREAGAALVALAVERIIGGRRMAAWMARYASEVTA